MGKGEEGKKERERSGGGRKEERRKEREREGEGGEYTVHVSKVKR